MSATVIIPTIDPDSDMVAGASKLSAPTLTLRSSTTPTGTGS